MSKTREQISNFFSTSFSCSYRKLLFLNCIMFQLIFCARTGKQFFFRVILRFLHTCLYRYIMFLHLHQHVERLLEIDRNNQMSNSEICKMEITRNKKRDSYLYIQQTQNRSRPLEMTSSSFKTTPGRAAESHFYSMLNEPLHSK